MENPLMQSQHSVSPYGRSKRALHFPVSPLLLDFPSALSAKIQDPQHVDLRVISESITQQEACYIPEGTQACVFPLHSGTNRAIQQQTELLTRINSKLDRLMFYQDYVGVSAQVCAVDAAHFTMKFLDFFLRKAFLDALASSEDSSSFEAWFKEVVLPFQTFNGDKLKYSKLLLCVESLQNDGLNLGNQRKLHCFLSLLHSAESSLFSTLYGQQGSPPLEACIGLRNDILGFLKGSAKRSRNVAAHLFTDLIQMEKDIPLPLQQLENLSVPRSWNPAFQVNDVKAMYNIGVKAIVLKDLSDKAICFDLSPSLLRMSLALVKFYIEKHVSFYISFFFGNMEAELNLHLKKDAQPFDLSLVRDSIESQKRVKNAAPYSWWQS